MKKRSILFLICSFLLFSKTRAQYLRECGTPSSSHDFLKDIPSHEYNRLPGQKVIKMFVVIYRDNNGANQAMTEAEVLEEIRVADSVYNIGNICFTVVGVELRNSTTYNNPIFPQNYSSEIVSDAFTVFVVNNVYDEPDSLSGIFGWSPGVVATYMITKKAGFGTRRTFIHEMGHALGLDHTFKGTGHDANNLGCDELADGSNGTTCGDFVQDTPADPYQRCGTTISGCSFPYTAPACKDANNQSYNPQMTNYMSYWANYDCNRTTFTTNQYTRMQDAIDNNASLSALLAPNTKTVSNATISSGFVKEAAVSSITAGPNYILNSSVKARITSSQIILVPGFVAQPNNAGIIIITPSLCQ